MANLKNQKDVFKLLTLSKSFMEDHTSDFSRNERLKEGRPKEGIPANYPRVTDKTLMKMINDTPKRVFQKIPNFTVDSGADKFTDIALEYILNEECINGDDNGYSFYQKLINAGRDADAFGACAVYSPFELADGAYRVGFVPIYWGDLFLEAYTTSINSANYVFIRQWKTEADMQAIIEDTDHDIDNGWKLDNVKELVKNHATSPKDATNTDKIGADDLYEVYTYMSKDEFITFSTQGDKILRQKDNKSKRKRIVGLYYDFDGVKPMGRSMVDIGGDLQDLIDADMQAYQFNRALALQPPVIISGDLDGGDGIYMPNNVLVSDDPSTAVKEISITTSAIENYPNIYAMQKSQLNALIPNASDTTISAEATGGLSSSKTPTGIKQNQMSESITDNFFFKNAEAFLSAWGENGLNIYANEFTGVIELQLNDVYADKARAENPEGVSPTGVVMLDCSAVTKIRVKVESGSTRDVAREEDLGRLNALVTMAGQSDIIASTIGKAGMQEIAMAIVKTSGVTNSGKIMEAIKKEQAEPQPAEEAAPAPPPKPLVEYKEAPEDVKRQMEQAEGWTPSTMTSPAQIELDQNQVELDQAETELDQNQTELENDYAVAMYNAKIKAEQPEPQGATS